MRRRQTGGRDATRRRAGIIAALVALALVAAGGATTAALHYAAAGNGADPAQGQEQAASVGADAEEDAGQGSDGSDSARESHVADVLRSHSWQAQDDSSKTVQFRDGSFVERDGKTSKVASFEIDDEQWDGASGSITCRITADGSPEAKRGVISLTGAEGSYRVSCDGFALAKSYVQGGKGEGPVAVSGVTEPYTTLIDGKTAELAECVASWCREHAPTATTAAFDGEVYLDVPAGTVSATFTCDDPAATAISVSYRAGKFEVRG